MKSSAIVSLAFAGMVPPSVRAADMTPVNRVLSLIRDLKVQVERDGKIEQKSYDKYACWCEATLERKASDIANGKTKIEQLSEHILKLKGDIGSHTAEIASLEKYIQENNDQQKEATQVRDNENSAVEAKKIESEQCIGALESAIKTLTGAGTGKSFLEIHKADLLIAAEDLRRVLSKGSSAVKSVSAEDMSVVNRFLANPAGAVSDSHKPAVSAAQVVSSHNPFGEYAPQSTQIQGILKGMYDAFVADIEKENVDEANKQKGFEDLIATKQTELATLQATLEQQTLDNANKGKDEALSQSERDDSQEQLVADESYFDETKKMCRQRAMEWAERSRLRSEELVGITQAIQIISSPEAKATFSSASSTFLHARPGAGVRAGASFLQLAGASEHVSVHTLAQASTHTSSGGSMVANTAGTISDTATRTRTRVYSHLKAVASKFGSLGLARIAMAVKAGGHFDNVINMIQDMIKLLRAEEASDIKHRDLCQNGIDKNNKDKAESQKNMATAAAAITEMNNKVTDLEEEVNQLDRDISQTHTDMEERLGLRNQERQAFEFAVKDDVEAVNIINKAIESLGAFFQRSGALAQVHKQGPGPEYTVDQDKAPELAWDSEGGNYGGRKSESGGILTILDMVAADVQKEIDTARKVDAADQAEYKQARKDMEDMLNAQTQSKIATEQEIADTQAAIAAMTAFHTQNDEALKLHNSLGVTLGSDCSWVQTHFQSRRDKRKTEMDALAEAKAILAGANSGDFDQATLAAAGNS